MASTSEGDAQPIIEEHVLEEEIEEETVWMEEDEQHFLNGSQQGDLAAQETVSAEEEYQEVDVEEYEESHFRTNLPDLLSKKVQLDNGSMLTLCFSKRGVQQLAIDGFLYNLSLMEGPASTWACVNAGCDAAIISVNDMAAISRDNDVHSEECVPDDLQLRLRVGVYDLRLMAEFTDVDLAVLYDNFLASFAHHQPDLAHFFPPFEAMRPSMQLHRRAKLLRRRFALREGEHDKQLDEEERVENDEALLLSVADVEVVHEEEVEEEQYETVPAERGGIRGLLAGRVERAEGLQQAQQQQPPHAPLHAYGRSRQLPATYCFECGIEMAVGEPSAFSPQHALIQHVSRIHQQAKIHSFVFEPGAFELWLREVQRCPVLRFRRFALVGDDMYYLCSSDERLSKSKYSARCHCTAYIKIADYRNVSARASRLVSVQYSFDHFGHDFIDVAPLETQKHQEKAILDLRPQEFLLQMERRRQATAVLVRSKNEGMRRQQLATAIAMRAGLKRNYLDLPRAYKEDVFSEARHQSRAAIMREIASTRRDGTRVPTKQATDPTGKTTDGKKEQEKRRITKRENFKDGKVYEAVHQCEVLSDMMMRRLQHAATKTVAERYYDQLCNVFNRMQSDTDGFTTQQQSARSIWERREVAKHGHGERPATSKDDAEKGPDAKRMRKGEEKEVGEGEERGGEGEKEGMEPAAAPVQKPVQKSRPQLPVKTTIAAAAARSTEKAKTATPVKEKGKVVEKETEERGGEEEEGERGTEKESAPPRVRSSRIQARKGKGEEAQKEGEEKS